MNALLCGSYLKQFSEVSHVDRPNACSYKCGRLLCTESCEDLVPKICDGSRLLIDNPGISSTWINFKPSSRSAATPTNMENSGINGKSAEKSECARLENAKYLSDLTVLHLLTEEAGLKAEINFLNACTEDVLSDLDETAVQEVVENLDRQCDYLKKACLKSLKELACNDTLEASRLMLEYRKARQTSYLNAQDRQIMEARLNCSKLEIFCDILALEDSALAELTQCLDKIYAALRKYLEITTDVKARFKSENESEEKENICATSPDFSAIDSELRAVLISLFGRSAGVFDGSDEELNAHVLSHLDKRFSASNSKSATSLSSLKEFARITHEMFDLLNKALHQLECPEDDKKQLSKAPVSSSVYWNELSPFTGVFPQRLIDRLLQVRKDLDATAAALQNLEISYKLHSESL
ncbi:hypothetical protein EmuJ_001046100 [Echinococcus multilocularis]|uniref:Uncharacterized protein n=1 Tax=Echinococcus multilocularis TaxID=6211 RepID=A0A068YDT6_ECHMU|nr:hypothetical protein EmuJ_001046100 [Echinococcus multilocularis]